MPTYFQRPENALKRANEFIDVGKKQRALDALYDVIKSKKHRTWQKIHEPIMEKYLELCVDLKKSHVAKEGLYQYKNICQQVNVRSLELVVRNYLRLAEEKTEAARLESQSIASEDVDIDDLDNIQTPESLLLSAVSGEDTQDRTDRLVLTPWVKFLWESYRQSLELLRNNSRVERLYHDVAQQGFRFCQKYNRKTEFRKLCENLRTHLSHVQKHQHTQTAININNQDTQAMNMETRLVQLDIAINMELWQEAFKAVEDIHELMNLSKKSPKPQLLANYYQKLGLVFWKAKNYLFHACTWHKLFHLFREQKKTLTQEELKRMATRVLLATLAIPIPPSENLVERYLPDDDNSLADKHRKLATLLDLPQPPTRAGLIKDLVKFNVIQFAAPQLQDLYRWLEVDFHPLKLCERVAKCLQFVRESEETDLQQYITAVEDISVMRLLKQVSQVYQTIEFSRICELVLFATPFRIERIVVEAAKTCDLQVLQQNRPQSKSDLQVRIDHRTRSLSFGTDLVVSQREDVPEGPNLQCMPSEHIRNQLTAMAGALHEAIAKIQPQDQSEDLRSQIVKMVQSSIKKDHRRILDRRTIIERRKEILEEITIQKEYEEQSKKEEEARKLYEAEMARLEREAEERKRQRIIQERKQIEMSQVKMRLEQLKKSGRTLDIDEEELEKMDPDELMQKQVEQLDKEKKELMARLKNQEKKVDHFARACRVEEIPVLEEQFREQSVNDRAFWEQQEEDRIETQKAERELALKHGSRLKRMVDDKDQFVTELTEARQSVFKDRLKEFEKMLAAEKVKRLNERKERRKAERKLKRQKEKEEAKHRAEEERKLLEEKEKARRIEEAKAKERAEYEARLAKIEEQTEKQKQREREVEERLAQEQRQAEARLEKDKGVREPWRPMRAGGWREREKQKEESWRRPSESDYEKRDDTFARRLGDEKGPGGKYDNERTADGERERDDVWSMRFVGTGPEQPGHRMDDGRGPPPRRLDDDRGPPPRRSDDDRGPPPRRFDDDRGPPPRRLDDDRGPPSRRLDDDRGPPPRRLDDDRGPPPRRLDDDRGPPPRRLDDDRGPPPRRFDDDRGPPARRFDDDRGPPPRRLDDERSFPTRRFDDDRGPPPRRFDDDRGPPPRRLDDERSFPSRRMDDDRGPPSRRLDDERGPPPRRLDDERGPPSRGRFPDERDSPRRYDDDRRLPPRKFEDDRGPRRFDDDRGPRRMDDGRQPRRYEDDRRGPPTRRFDDDRGPPARRLDDDRGPRRLDERDRRGFDDRDGPRRGFEDQGPWRRGGDRENDWRGGPPRSLDGRGTDWRKDGPARDLPPRDDRGPYRDGGDPGLRRDSPGPRDDGDRSRDDLVRRAPPRSAGRDSGGRFDDAGYKNDATPAEDDDEGWVTVKR